MDKENKYNIETVIFEYNKKDKEFEMFLDSIFRDYINNDKILPDELYSDSIQIQIIQKSKIFQHN